MCGNYKKLHVGLQYNSSGGAPVAFVQRWSVNYSLFGKSSWAHKVRFTFAFAGVNHKQSESESRAYLFWTPVGLAVLNDGYNEGFLFVNLSYLM